MKKLSLSLPSLLVLFTLFSLTSCNKEESSNGTQFRATIEDCTSQNGKTTLSGTALNWVSGDRIVVYGTAGRGIYSATPQTPATTADFDHVSGETGSAPFRSFYPTSLTTNGVNITLPATQTYVENSIHEFPMYAESNSNTLEFKNLCGVLKLRLTKSDVSISTISITTSCEINGTFSISYSGDDLELNHVSGGSSRTTLSCATAQSIANGKFFYVYLPAGNYRGLQIEVNSNDGRYCVKTANTSISVVRSHYTLITFGENDLNFMEPLPQGTLPGLFSVSSTQQVRFSQGNLQYQASTQTWRFAEHQYDFVGADNANISDTYTGWIDLFGWGTGNNPAYSSYNHSSYSHFIDWGQNIVSGGGDWHTLSISEWDYLMSNRPNATSKYGAGSVNGVPGEILLPDSWTIPTGLTFIPGNNNWQNNYTLSEWERMETAGAVFLPASGYRSSEGINGIGAFGGYWSTTDRDDNNSAYGLRFYDLDYTTTSYYDWRSNGFSVRLVRSN